MSHPTFKIKLRTPTLITWNHTGSSCVSSRAVQTPGEAFGPRAVGGRGTQAGSGAPWALEGSVRYALPAWCRLFIHLRAGEECGLGAQRFNYRLSCSCRTIIPYSPSIFPTSDPTLFFLLHQNGYESKH